VIAAVLILVAGVLVGALLLLLALWFAYTYLLWRLGWRVFAQRYSTDLEAPQSFIAQSATFGHVFASYPFGVRLGFLPQGLHFSAALPLGVAHAPFLLPWARLREAELQRGPYGERVRVMLFDEAGRVTLVLPAAAWSALQAARPPLR
jgi:hypothetical protein